MFARTIVLLLAVLMLAGPALGQQKKKKKEDRKRGTLTGPIISLVHEGRGVVSGIQFNNNGKPWIAQLEPPRPQKSGTIIEVHGFATRDALSPGLHVSFEVDGDGSNEELPPLPKIRVFSPQEGWRPGIQREPTGLGDGERVFVSGRLARIDKDGKLTLNLGGRQNLDVELTDDAVIEVFLDDLRVVQPGDVLEVAGNYWWEGEIFGSTIKVTLGKYIGPGGRRVDPPPTAAAPKTDPTADTTAKKETPKRQPKAEPKPEPKPEPTPPKTKEKKPEPSDSDDDDDDDDDDDEPGFLEFPDE